MVAVALAIAFFLPLGGVGRATWSNIENCVIPDRDVLGNRRFVFKLYSVEPEGPNKCILFPTLSDGSYMRATHLQFFLIELYTVIPLMITILYALTGLIYWAELPFIEKFKTRPEEPWPWKKDPKAFKKVIKESMLMFYFNCYVSNPVITAIQFYSIGY